MESRSISHVAEGRNEGIPCFGNIYGEVAFMPELKYRANFGVDIYSSSQDTFRPSTIPISNTEGNPESVPEATAKTAKMYNWLFEQTMSYNKEIHGHSLSALVGWTMQYQRDESTYALPTDSLRTACPLSMQVPLPAAIRMLPNGPCFQDLPEFSITIKASTCLQEQSVPTVLPVWQTEPLGMVSVGICRMASDGRAIYEVADFHRRLETSRQLRSDG